MSHVPDDVSRRMFLRRTTAMTLAGGAALVLTGSENTAAGSVTVSPAGQAVNFRDLQDHENAHVRALVRALGSRARPKPRFKNLVQPNFTAFARVSQALENTGVGAYFGALPAIKNRANVVAAGSIALIEARHAGYLNTFLGDRTTADTDGDGSRNSFEDALTPAQVVRLASPFIRDLNGGPPLTYSNTPSDANDLAIVNFALALEYLEAEFYNINVPRFF